MDDPRYEFNGKIWQSCRTLANGDSFFHAAFGRLNEKSLLYYDIDASFRRRCWSNFVYFFENNTPGCLDKYVIENKDVTQRQHCVNINEIPIIATVENIIIIIFVDNNKPPIIITPDLDLENEYPLRNKNALAKVVINYDGNVYSRLSFTNQIINTKRTAHYKKLKGSAGIKGSLYQVNLLTIFLLNGLYNHTNWRLSTENEDAGKFDDLVIEFLPSRETIFLQAKNRKNKFKKITVDDIFSLSSEKNDFSLPKYFSSYQKIKTRFKVTNIILCTNVDLHEKVKSMVNCSSISEDHMLYFQEAGGRCYKFNVDGIMENLRQHIRDYYRDNLKNEVFQEDMVSYQCIKDFLEHLQFIADYPGKGDLDQIVENMISTTDYCDNYNSRDFFKIINKKMIDWFENDKGKYLTRTDAKALFCEVLSDKFCEKLLNCNIFFKTNDFKLYDKNRFLHIIPLRDPILYMMKIYQLIHGVSKENKLFINPSESVSSQKQIVDIFELPHYIYLVVCIKTNNINVIGEMAEKLDDILNAFQYKKVIIIARKEDKLVTKIRKNNESLYFCVTEDILFTDLTDESLKTLLEKVTLFF